MSNSSKPLPPPSPTTADHHTNPPAPPHPSPSRLNAQAPEFIPRTTISPSSTHPTHFLYPPQPPLLNHPVYFHPNRRTYAPYIPVQYNYNRNSRTYHPHSDDNTPNNSGVTEEVKQKIVSQVEYYFSDVNLATTGHLIRFIRKDREGYVPISVVSSIKKIKSLVSSSSQLASILRGSAKLVVSEDGKKVRRQSPLTESDLEELKSRIVVAENLPEDHRHQNLMKIFSAIGSVKSIRTCLPQTSSDGPSSGAKTEKSDGLLYSIKLHAFVEYESVELAEKAVVELNEEEGNWRNGLRLRLLHKCSAKPAQARAMKVGHGGEGHYRDDVKSTSNVQEPNEKHVEDSPQQAEGRADPSHNNLVEQRTNGAENKQKKGRNHGRGKGRQRAQHHNNDHSPRGNHAKTIPQLHPVKSGHPPVARQPPGPRMPDGTRGFSMGRGKLSNIG